MTRPSKPLWFSIPEAADYLNIGEPTLYRWMKEGKITFRKVGDSTRFLQQDLDEVVEVVHSQKKAPQVREQCPGCGGPDLVEGTARTSSLIHFQPKKTKFWVLADSVVDIQAKMCARCGMISLFGDAQKLQRLREQRTESPEQSQGPSGELSNNPEKK